MKETRFLVHLKENGYIKKVTKEGEWEFTKNLKESLKFKTITGAYIRLIESKKISDLSEYDSCILVLETSDDSFKVISKLEYKLSKSRGRPPKEETKVELPEVDPSKVKKLNEGVDEKPKKRRGRPRKETPIKTVQINDVSGTTTSEPLVKKNKEEIKTEIVESDLNVVVEKVSEEDSFWD